MIPDLPPLYVDHLVQPRGQEDLPQAEAVGQQGSMVGGMGVRVTLSYREGHNHEALIRAASARVFGSAGPLAPASYLTEYVVGMPPEAAQEIRPDDLLHALAGHDAEALPAAVKRGAASALDALHCALGLPGCRPSDPQGGGMLVCRCLSVGDRPIREAVSRGASTPEAVSEACRAGLGCRSCRPDLLVLIHAGSRAPAPPPSKDLHPVIRVTLARVGPLLAAHGLPLRDAEVTDDAVFLQLGSPTRTDAIRPAGARAMARHLLRDVVSEDIQVEVDEPA